MYTVQYIVYPFQRFQRDIFENVSFYYFFLTYFQCDIQDYHRTKVLKVFFFEKQQKYKIFVVDLGFFTDLSKNYMNKAYNIKKIDLLLSSRMSVGTKCLPKCALNFHLIYTQKSAYQASNMAFFVLCCGFFSDLLFFPNSTIIRCSSNANSKSRFGSNCKNSAST